MIRSLRGQIAIGIVTLFAGLIVMFPARLAVQWFAPPDVAISGIAGTAWSGRADEATVAGLYLSELEWNFSPLKLVTGKLSYSLSANPASGFVETDVSVGFGGNIVLSKLNASLPLGLFAGFTGVPGLQGSSSLQFERLEIVAGRPIAADGVLQIADLLVPMAGRESLGGYRVDFSTQDDGIAASIEDKDGVVDLAGSLLLSANGEYRILAQVVAHDGTPESIRQNLRFLPPANERGQQELRLEGIL